MEDIKYQEYKLTQYSHGAGCGCKISPQILDTILKTNIHYPAPPQLLVGNATKDDAAVYELDSENCIISTTDFFMPIVDDAYNFGRIASANAISDIYAMGGTPIMAIAILGWTIDKLPPELAGRVLEGSRFTCNEAGIPLAGGHSIDCPEPIYGLAVTGIVPKANLKRNDTATEGCLLYLTKPLGVGILSTAQKKGILKEVHEHIAPEQMMKLNKIGADLGKLKTVKALTDITGFGLLGHLREMCEGSNLSAEIDFHAVPKLPFVDEYLAQKSIPGGTVRNWNSYGHLIHFENEGDALYQRQILADPQTSGGLLVAAEAQGEPELQAIFQKHNLALNPIGKLLPRNEKLILVR
jgi:selenide,water dikinase